MLKWIGLIILGAIFLAGSCYDWSRVSETGVLSQETCRDNPKPGCVHPEDIRDSVDVAVDPVTGDTIRTIRSRAMFKGRPNGLGWIFFVIGGGLLAGGGYGLVGLVKDRRKAKKAAEHRDKYRGTDVPAWLPLPVLALQLDTLVEATEAAVGRSEFGWLFWMVMIVGTGVLAYLWSVGHPDLIDRPDPVGTSRGWWNAHSIFHLLGAAGISFLITLVHGPTPGVVAAIILGLEVELFQKFPRDGGGGTIEFMDIFWDIGGAIGGALIGTIIGCAFLNFRWC
jgi:hypothetical protein